MYRLILILFITGYFAASCIDRIELPIRTEEPHLVVDGQITNEPPPYKVRLTYTGTYGEASGQNPDDQYVKGALVSLSDDQGRLARFVSTGQGMYQTTDTTFRGQVGRAYSLTVVLSNGQRYVTKAERMPAVPAIDSISKVVAQTENSAKPYVCNYTVNTHDPGSEKNYYRWTAYGTTSRLSKGVSCCTGCTSICFNRCWVTVSNDAVNISTDEAINGNPIQNRFVLQVPIYTLGPQLIEVQQYGMTQANYQFWKLYQQQSSRTGSIFDPLPAPVAGNVMNADNSLDLARGYFAVTSVTRQRVRVYNYNARFYMAMASYIFDLQLVLYGGDCRDIYGAVPVTEPDGW